MQQERSLPASDCLSGRRHVERSVCAESATIIASAETRRDVATINKDRCIWSLSLFAVRICECTKLVTFWLGMVKGKHSI